MKKRKFNLSLSISVILILVFVGIQFIPVNNEEKENKANNDFFEVNKTPENIRNLIEACYAFNSDATEAAWYTYVAPFSWFNSKQNYSDNDNLTSQPYVDPFDSLHINIFKKDIDTLVLFTLNLGYENREIYEALKKKTPHYVPPKSYFRRKLQEKLLDPTFLNEMDSLLLPFSNNYSWEKIKLTNHLLFNYKVVNNNHSSYESYYNDTSYLDSEAIQKSMYNPIDSFHPENQEQYNKRVDGIMHYLNLISLDVYTREEIAKKLPIRLFRRKLNKLLSASLPSFISREILTNDKGPYNNLVAQLYGYPRNKFSFDSPKEILNTFYYFKSLIKPYLKNSKDITFIEASKIYQSMKTVSKYMNAMYYRQSASPEYCFELVEKNILNDDRFTDAYKFELLMKINNELPMKFFYFQGNLKSIVNKLMDEYREGYKEYMVHVAKAYMTLRPHMKMLQWKKQVENASVTNWNLVPVQKSPELLNLSMWSKFSNETKHELLQQMINEVQNKMMPPKAYVLLHPEARLTDEQRTELINYLHSVDPLN